MGGDGKPEVWLEHGPFHGGDGGLSCLPTLLLLVVEGERAEWAGRDEREMGRCGL